MKTAVSIPDDVFAQAERFAEQAGYSRSHLFSEALREYVARHSPETITDKMDEVCATIESPIDPFLATAVYRVVSQTEW